MQFCRTRSKLLQSVFFSRRPADRCSVESATVVLGSFSKFERVLLQLACCCGSAACGLCCQSCPSCRNSTSTRIMYGIMLFLGTTVSLILLAPAIQTQLADVSTVATFLYHVQLLLAFRFKLATIFQFSGNVNVLGVSVCLFDFLS